MTDLDAGLDHLELLHLPRTVEALFSVNVPALDKFFPDRRGKLVGVFGESLNNPDNVAEVSANYFKCGYDIVVLTEVGDVAHYQINNKCKVLLRSPDGH